MSFQTTLVGIDSNGTVIYFPSSSATFSWKTNGIRTSLT
jgi:hypothetical protein